MKWLVFMLAIAMASPVLAAPPKAKAKIVTIEIRVEKVTRPLDPGTVVSTLRAFKAVQNVEIHAIDGKSTSDTLMAAVTLPEGSQERVDFVNALRRVGYSADGVKPDPPSRQP